MMTDYEIKDRDKLLLVIREARISIFVQGYEDILKVRPSWRVLKLKQKLYEKGYIQEEEQQYQISYFDMLLQDERTLGEYNIKEGEFITLVLPVERITIYVNLRSGRRKKQKLDVSPEDKIESVKY